MTETLKDLKRAAAERGHEVSDSQLERWRKRGLLPRPVDKEYLGRYGSESFYPDGTAQQLVDLLYFKTHVDRRLDEVGSCLWCIGHPVVRWARKALEKRFADRIEHYDEALDAYERGEIDNPISRLVYESLRGPMAHLRQRLGRRHLQEVMRVMYEVMAGYFKLSSLAEAEVSLQKLQAIMDGEVEDHARFRKILLMVLGNMTATLEPTQHLQAARSASDEELLRVRDEALTFWRQLDGYLEGKPTRMPWAVFEVWFMVRLGSSRGQQLLEKLAEYERFQEAKREFFSGTMRLPDASGDDE